MIISRTPYRVSFVGGGTDFPGFYRQHSGMVVSTTIRKYMHIAVSEGFEDHMRLSYSRTEVVSTVPEIQHPLIREALKLTGLTNDRLHIYSMGDVPAGTGLGSSSAFLVGLLQALWAYRGHYAGPRELAEQACHIEIEVLGEPIGKQDQYAAAIGGLQLVRFNRDDTVDVRPVVCTEVTRAVLDEWTMLFYLGSTRASRAILTEQKANVGRREEQLLQLRDLVPPFVEVLEKGGDVAVLGDLLHDGWLLKKRLSTGISSPTIDEHYERAREAGAVGGKLLGAGGTGFLLVLCEPNKQADVRQALAGLRHFPVALERDGTRIIFHDPVRGPH